MSKRATKRDRFIRVFQAKRVKLGIREAATEALQEVVGAVRISKRLDGYLLIADPFETEADDHENDFLRAAGDLAGCFLEG
jgi:hypothetical protein